MGSSERPKTSGVATMEMRDASPILSPRKSKSDEKSVRLFAGG